MDYAKPCPFCGKEPEWRHYSKGYFPSWPDEIKRVTEWQSSIGCKTCLIQFSGFGKVEWKGGNALAHQYAIKRVLEKWNNRVPREETVPADAQLLVAECASFLKEGETPAECIVRNRKEALTTLVYYTDAHRYRVLRALWLHQGGLKIPLDLHLAETADEFDKALDATRHSSDMENRSRP